MTVFTEAALRRHVRTLPHATVQLVAQLDRVLVASTKPMPRGVRLELGSQITALRCRLAQLFGERHGWQPCRVDFAPSVLARRGVRRGYDLGMQPWPRHLSDHPYFFRASDRRAAAVAAHLYLPSAETRTQAIEWASLNDLHVEFPTDFPSWWVPGGTSLCVYTPAEEFYEHIR